MNESENIVERGKAWAWVESKIMSVEDWQRFRVQYNTEWLANRDKFQAEVKRREEVEKARKEEVDALIERKDAIGLERDEIHSCHEEQVRSLNKQISRIMRERDDWKAKAEAIYPKWTAWGCSHAVVGKNQMGP